MSQRPKKQHWIIGIDEVGRGPLAGPVCVCAVAIQTSMYQRKNWGGLTDSKKMTRNAREIWACYAKKLKEEGRIKIGIAYQSAVLIDRKGIGACIKACIVDVLEQIAIDPNQCSVRLDGGLKAPMEYTHQATIIKGDLKEKAISLASVVAKVHRDAYMTKCHKKYVLYGWDANKGYGTKAHIAALLKYGLTPLHRKSFLTRILDNI